MLACLAASLTPLQQTSKKHSANLSGNLTSTVTDSLIRGDSSVALYWLVWVLLFSDHNDVYLATDVCTNLAFQSGPTLM